MNDDKIETLPHHILMGKLGLLTVTLLNLVGRSFSPHHIFVDFFRYIYLNWRLFDMKQIAIHRKFNLSATYSATKFPEPSS
jgi:hypothetical protein